MLLEQVNIRSVAPEKTNWCPSRNQRSPDGAVSHSRFSRDDQLNDLFLHGFS